MTGSVYVFRFDKGEKATWILLVQQANGRASHIVHRRLALLIAIKLKTHVTLTEQAQDFAARDSSHFFLIGKVTIAFAFEGGDHVGIVATLAPGLPLA